MKKIVALILAVIIALMVAGCGSDTPDDTSNIVVPPASEPTVSDSATQEKDATTSQSANTSQEASPENNTEYADDAFIADVSKAIETTWKKGEEFSPQSTGQLTQEYFSAMSTAFDDEINTLSKYRTSSFKDSTLQILAVKYLNSLDSFKSALATISVDYMSGSAQLSAASEQRGAVIAELVNNYGLTVSDQYQSKLMEEVESAKKEILPDGNYTETGNGRFYVVTPSGTSENGNIPIIYTDEQTTYYQLEYDAWDFDGTLLSYVYIDNVLVAKEQLANNQSFEALTGDYLTEGVHTVIAVQYDNNDSNGNIITYKTASYEIRYK